jgi:hypothetical protein
MIILFDVDGVLVENRAYRAGIQQTTRYFGQRLGLATAPPTDADIDVFEAESITVEWDSCAIVAAALLMGRLRAEARTTAGRSRLAGLPGDVWQFLEALPARSAKKTDLDYPALARRAGAAARATGLLPAQAALGLYQRDLAGQDHLPTERARLLLEHLLGQVYDIDQSPAMQIFQNYALGDAQYAEYYGLLPRVAGTGLLEALDRPNLRPDLCRAILERREAGSLFPVVFTARPSWWAWMGCQ